MSYPIHVVGAIIIDRGLVLCARRGGTGPLGGLWEFPGGKVEADESEPAALVREIREELGCGIEVGAPVAKTVHEYPFATIRLSTYFCTLAEGTPAPTEHSELRWLTPAQLHELTWAPADLEAVEAVAESLA